MRQRRTRQEWQALLDEQPRSGLSIQRFCQSEGITPSNFYGCADPNIIVRLIGLVYGFSHSSTKSQNSSCPGTYIKPVSQ